MSLETLPLEVFILILSDLDIEDQFNLSLTGRRLHRIASSELLCRASLEVGHRFSPEYSGARGSENYAKAWRRLVKKRIAIKNATPYQACVLGFGEQSIFSNGALIYKPKISEIRIMLLDGSAHEELHVDTTRLLMEAKRLFSRDLSYEATVEPLHYAHGTATFIVEEEIGDGSQDCWILVANVQQETVIEKCGLNAGRCVFALNTEKFLWLGERSITVFESETPQWRLRMLDLETRVWEAPEALPVSFGGVSLGQDVCFEIINGFVYGVQSKTDEVTGHTVHHVVRLQADGGPVFDYGYFILSHKASHHDNRYNELKITRDACTGAVFVYEVRTEYVSSGYSTRVRRSYCVNFPDTPIPQKTTHDSSFEPLELIGALESHKIQYGDCGLSIAESDPRRFLAHNYDTSTHTFLDMMKELPSDQPRPSKLYLRSRSNADIISQTWSFSTLSAASTSSARLWPSICPRKTQNCPLQTILNPTGLMVDTTQSSFWNGLLVFSPFERGIEGPRPIILLSFDPGLHIPGLRKPKYRAFRLALESLRGLSERMDTKNTGWIAKVKPFHLLIRSLEKESGHCYGVDSGYERLELA